MRDDHAMWYGLERVDTPGVDDPSHLPYGPGSNLWIYWTKGKGLAKWASSLHKWRALRRHLIKYVPAHMVDGLTTNMVQAVFPGYMKEHKKLHHNKGE